MIKPPGFYGSGGFFWFVILQNYQDLQDLQDLGIGRGSVDSVDSDYSV
jgi:hypothetical protein